MLKRPFSLAALAALALTAAATLSACGSESDTTAADAPPETASASPSATPTPASQGACQYPSAGTAAKAANAPASTPTAAGIVPVTLKLNSGEIKLKLNAKEAPCTVNSFLSLAKQGYFDNTTCHRLTTQGIFVLQCGDPSATGSGGPGYSFADELDGAKALTGTDQQKNYAAGTLAMANAGPATNGSQFFLVYEDSPLAPAYSVFGTFDAAGVTAVKKIAAAGLAADGVAPKQSVGISAVTAP